MTISAKDEQRMQKIINIKTVTNELKKLEAAKKNALKPVQKQLESIKADYDNQIISKANELVILEGEFDGIK